VFFLSMMNGLWALWAKGRAVDNGFIVIHGKRPGSPQANCRTPARACHLQGESPCRSWPQLRS